MNPLDVAAALSAKTSFELVDPNITVNQIRLIGRVRLVQGRMDAWLAVVDRLLDAAEQTEWSIDVSRPYFKREGRLRYAHRLIFQAQNIAQHVPSIIAVINSVEVPKGNEVSEVPLVGVNRNYSGGKGASNIGKFKVGQPVG